MKGTILVLFSVLLFGCAPQQERGRSEAPSVFVSIPPLAGLLRAIAGDHVQIRTLVGEGQSPHAYEPTARQLAALGEADILFTIGVPFEKALAEKVRPLYPGLEIVATDAGIEKRAMPHHNGEACTHSHGEPDPHVWLDPVNAIRIATRMAEALDQNPTELIGKLEQIDKAASERLAPFEGKRFYVFHPSFGYFADRYGLEQVPIELDGKSPSPRQLAGLIEQAQADGVKVVFVQKQFPAESARAVADAIGGAVVQLDPLAEDVVANLGQIAEAIRASYE
jgi:zinc transport system substrate-binding protein